MNKESRHNYFCFKVTYLNLIRDGCHYPSNMNVKIKQTKCSWLTFSLKGERFDTKLYIYVL